MVSTDSIVLVEVVMYGVVGSGGVVGCCSGLVLAGAGVVSTGVVV